MSGESTAAGGPTEAGRPTEAGEAGELVELATRWLDDDPDPDTRSELRLVIAAAQSGDEAAAVDLANRFAGMLEFGTAGLRGAIGAGPNRMNRAVVIRAAAGLTAWLKDEGGEPEPVVVIGFDARHKSDEFARDTAAVVAAAGGRAMVPRPLPTPVLAFAIRYLGAHAGVMVTASHNPPQDNGYKAPPRRRLGRSCPLVDAEIAAHIAAVPSVASVPRVEDGWENLGDEIEQAYVDAAASVSVPTRLARYPSCTPARRRVRHRREGFLPQRIPRAARGVQPAGARPRLPQRGLPQPRGAGRDRRREVLN